MSSTIVPEDTVYYYELRLTPYPNTKQHTLTTRSRIAPFIESQGGHSWLFGQEFEENYHFHIVFASDDRTLGLKKSANKKRFIEQLYSFFEVPQDKKGNPTFKLDNIRDLDKAMAYAVKDGDYSSSMDWETDAEEAYSRSFEKHHSLKRSINTLTEDFIDNKINEKGLFVGLCNMRAELRLGVRINQIDEQVLSIKMLKDPELAGRIWEDREIKKSN